MGLREADSGSSTVSRGLMHSRHTPRPSAIPTASQPGRETHGTGRGIHAFHGCRHDGVGPIEDVMERSWRDCRALKSYGGRDRKVARLSRNVAWVIAEERGLSAVLAEYACRMYGTIRISWHAASPEDHDRQSIAR